MSTPAKTKWRIAGQGVASCNCAWGCPCQFNALPTHGRCEAFAAWQIQEGHFGDTRLDGVRHARIFWFPGAVHEGNGIAQSIIDSAATSRQREALLALWSGTRGGPFFEIFSAVCPNVLEPIFAPIAFEADRDRRRATIRVPTVGEIHTEPIKNPVTGEEHRARIVLPNGFEFKEAEMGNSVSFWVKTAKELTFAHQNTYAHLYAFDWSS